MDIEYVEATASDAKCLLEFLKQVATETHNLTFEADELVLNELQEIENIKASHDSKNSLMILAKDNGRIVGNVTLSGSNRKRIQHRSSLGISVLKEYWHQEIGSNLLAAAIGYAIENDIAIIELEVLANNKNAIALYEKFGFETIGVYKEYFIVNGEAIDAKLMNLYL